MFIEVSLGQFIGLVNIPQFQYRGIYIYFGALHSTGTGDFTNDSNNFWKPGSLVTGVTLQPLRLEQGGLVLSG